MISTMTRLVIHHMSAMERPSAEIADAVTRTSGETVSARSVRRVVVEPLPTQDEVAERGPGRPSTMEAWRERIATALDGEEGLSTTELLRRARDWGFSGKKSAFFVLVRSLRKATKVAEPLVRFETAPGEQAQFDFGEEWVLFPDGRREKRVLFVGRLKYSRHVHVVVVPDQTAETLIRGVVSCLEAWDCVPLIWVFDNPKTVRVSPIGSPIVLHAYLQGIAAELNAAVMLCTPYQPQQKGSVERAVKWVKGSFLAQRRFHDDPDLVAQLSSWLSEVNTVRVSDATKRIPAELLRVECTRLGADRHLPFTAASYQLRILLSVLPTGMVHVIGTDYSVDPRRIGVPAIALIGRDTVEIAIGATRCTHRRIDYAPQPQRLPEHRQAVLAVVHGERKANSFKRQCLWELGGAAREFLEMLVHHCGANAIGWYRPVLQLYTLWDEHGTETLTAALAICNGQRDWTVPAVVRALKPQVAALACSIGEAQS
jgi:transposase